MSAQTPIDISAAANGSAGLSIGAGLTTAIVNNATLISLSFVALTFVMALVVNVINVRTNLRRTALLEKQSRVEP